jgi:hypothetical protein
MHQVTSEEMSRFFRELARKRWQRATKDERFRSAQHASVARWEAFREWKTANPEAAAAAAAVAKALRFLRPRPEVSDDEEVERLERRLIRARHANTALLPWSDDFKRRARRKES